MYCYSNNGMSMRAVDPDYTPQTGEVLFDHFASNAELAGAFADFGKLKQAESAATSNADIKAQLTELDGKSIRALHEAVLALAASGTALPADTVKRLQDLETQKEALRAKLV